MHPAMCCSSLSVVRIAETLGWPAGVCSAIDAVAYHRSPPGRFGIECPAVRAYLVFLMLFGLKLVAKIFYRVDLQWIGNPPPDRWRHHQVVALLNHTSLYE